MLPDHSLKKIVRDYLDNNLELFRSNLEKAQREHDPDAIHDYRVAVKRIRAVVRAVDQSFQDGVFPENLIVPLRLMFKAGGTIRDDQVQLGMLEELENEYGQKFPLIREYYLQKMKDQKSAFFVKSFDLETADLNQIGEEISESLAPLDEHELETNLYQWLHSSMTKLQRKRYDLDNAERLHRFRTRYKQNSYIVELLYLSKFDRRITKSSFSVMKAFGQLMGEWHDYFQLMSNTAFIFKESRNVKLLEESLELRKLVTPKHDRIMQEILHQIKRDDSLFSF